jgi:hypothetical protein
MRTLRILIASLALLALAASAQAGPPGQWTRLPGTVLNFAEPGLARTSDGVLHVVYVRQNGTKDDLMHAEVSPAGKVAPASVALAGWSSIANPDLLRLPDGSLRSFFGGIRTASAGEPNNALNTATAPAAGAPWTLQIGKAAQAQYAYSTKATGAGLAKDGTPISAWAATAGLGYHYGTDPATPDRIIPQSGCCLYTPEIAVDSASGQAWIGFHSLEKATPGLFVNAIGPAGPQGGRRLAPGSVTGQSSVIPGNRTPLTGRIGAGGVYLFYGQGYPTFGRLALWKVDTAKPHLVLKAAKAKHANAAAAPEGRLWLMWDQGGTIHATRTNRSATRVGPVTTLRAPGSRTVFQLSGEGSAGPLDAVVNDGKGLWHQQIWPRLSLTGKRAGKTIVFRVLDAGDPVAAATVKAGGKTLKTVANGTATLGNAPSGKVQAAASKAGYAPASASVR